jgi:hypothetical protein
VYILPKPSAHLPRPFRLTKNVKKYQKVQIKQHIFTLEIIEKIVINFLFQFYLLEIR